MSGIAQSGARRNRKLSYGYENGRLVVRETINGATIVRLTTDFGEHLRELYRRFGYDVNAKRLSEIERVILARHGGPVNTDDGPAYLSAAFNARALSWRHRRWLLRPSVLIAWARRWTPHVPEAEARELAERVCAGPRRLKGTTVGRWMRIDGEDKEALGLTTIDPCNVDSDELAKQKTKSRKEADQKRKESARRANGARPRSESLRAVCRRHGITAWQERTLRKFCGRKGEVERYLNRIGVDGAAHHLFVRLLDIQTTIEREDTSNHADEKMRQEPEAMSDNAKAAARGAFPALDAPGAVLTQSNRDALEHSLTTTKACAESDGVSTACGPQAAEAPRATPRSHARAGDDMQAWLVAEMEARRRGAHLSDDERAWIEAKERAGRAPVAAGAPYASLAMEDIREAGGALRARRSHRIVYSGHNRRPDHAA